MQKTRTRAAGWLLAAGLAVVMTSGEVRAQTYPSQDVHFIVGFAAGSGPDVIARFVAEKMRPLLGKPVIVENKVGAGGNIATEYVARSRLMATRFMSPAAAHSPPAVICSRIRRSMC